MPSQISWLLKFLDTKENCSLISTFTDWTKKDEDEKDVNVWEDNWDDDNVEDDFNQQLR